MVDETFEYAHEDFNVEYNTLRFYVFNTIDVFY